MRQKSKPILGELVEGRLYLTRKEKRIIIDDYLSGDETKREVFRRYTGHSTEHGKINKWLRQFNLEDKKSSKFVGMSKTKKSKASESTDLEVEVLQKRIKDLENKLDTAEMKAIAYSTMVDIAEKEFDIPIRKKYNTKPSKK